MKDREQLAVDPLESILISGPSKCAYVSSLMSKEERERLQQILQANADVFALTHSDMIGISPMHASHKLNVVSFAIPVRQRVRRSHPDRHQVIQAEVDNLLKVWFIREVRYPEWLANVVVVLRKGANGEYV